jgi:Ribbon-helix-helix domain
MKKVLITDSYMSLLKEYSDRTGIPVARCVSDALSDWLVNVAPLEMDYVNQQSSMASARYQNVIFMKSGSR